MKEKFILSGTVFYIVLSLLISSKKIENQPEIQYKKLDNKPQFVIPSKPESPNITTQIPNYLSYNELIIQLKEWENEASDLTEVSSYGKSSKNKEIFYIKITNELEKNIKKKVMISACIHGNEPLSASIVMGYIGTMLANYGKDEEITKLIDTREIYFVPVVSPDSYPNSRYVDGVDPNRDFTNKKSTSVIAIQKFAEKEKFNAIMSGHTFGRLFLIPWGDKTELSPNNDDFDRIVGEMSKLSGYKKIRSCEIYGTPIFGSEIDWYYRQGSFSIICEFGTHQKIPTKQEIEEEFNRTWKSFLHFLTEAPIVKIR
jgi:hypothetical protein